MDLHPHYFSYAYVPQSALYFSQCVEVPNVKIFHYQGGINFATKNTFRSGLYEMLSLNPAKELILRQKVAQYESNVSICIYSMHMRA